MDNDLQINVLERVMELLGESGRVELDGILKQDSEEAVNEFLVAKGIDLAQITAEEQAKLEIV